MNRKINVFFTGLILIGILFSSCEKVIIPEAKVEGEMKFSVNILPIFNKCNTCHGGTQKPDLRSDFAYKSLTTGGYINTAVPEDSKLYMKIISSSHESRTTSEEKKMILLWIQQGALNN